MRECVWVMIEAFPIYAFVMAYKGKCYDVHEVAYGVVLNPSFSFGQFFSVMMIFKLFLLCILLLNKEYIIVYFFSPQNCNNLEIWPFKFIQL